jgi:hypothetical protein
LLDRKYGPGNWKEGPKSEHNQIKKFGDTDFKETIHLPIDNWLEIKKELEEQIKDYQEKKKEYYENCTDCMS